jgi:hypothetical protein
MRSIIRPVFGDQLGLLQDYLRGFFLLVGRIAVFAQGPSDHHTQLGSHVLLDGPVNRDVLVDLVN